jgi:glutamate mutase epsilon subunit
MIVGAEVRFDEIGNVAFSVSIRGNGLLREHHRYLRPRGDAEDRRCSVALTYVRDDIVYFAENRFLKNGLEKRRSLI